MSAICQNFAHRFNARAERSADSIRRLGQFADLANDYQVVLSLGRTGQCWDNALAESFSGSLKGELIDLQA
jgi:transposase InsO family protein